MQVFNEDDYPEFDEIKKELCLSQNKICESKTLYKYYLDKYIKDYNSGYYGDWDSFYFHYKLKIVDFLKKIKYNDDKKCKKLKNNLILKKFIRNNLDHYLYKPNGLRYHLVKNHFDLSLIDS